MDTNTREEQQQQAAGRPAANRPRRRYSVSQKLEMVKATLDGGQSVSVVARQYDVNANQLFHWRKQHRDGLLVEDSERKLLPIRVCETPVADTLVADSSGGVSGASADGTLEVILFNQHRIRIIGTVCQNSLATILRVLS